MTRACSYPAPTTGAPCTQLVADDADHCSAGHPCPPVGPPSSGTSPRHQAMAGVGDVDDLFDDEWPPADELDVAARGEYAVAQSRIEGALLGLAAGDALGATVEFKSAQSIAAQFPDGHRDIIGGGPFGWRPGQGTDDSDMTIALARAYADDEGFSVEGAADHFLEWYKSGPRDVGGTTASGLTAYRRSGDPTSSGRTDDRSAANGSLMRAIATGLVRPDDESRRDEARAVSAITHGERRCLEASVIYCDIAARLMDGEEADAAIEWALEHSPVSDDVKEVVSRARTKSSEELDTTGYVLGSLEVSVWAVSQKTSLEDTLVEVVSRGNDTDTTGAIAGGLLGAAHGAGAIPKRWRDQLEYAPEIRALTPRLADVRFEHRTPVPAGPLPAEKPSRRRGLLGRLFRR